MTRIALPHRLYALSAMTACIWLASIDARAVDNSGELDELIVTARKREEPIERTPVAVTALSGDDLDRAFVLTLTDLGGSSPNVAFHSVGEFGHSASLSIRGVGGGGANFDTDPAVAIYVDDLYQTANNYNLEDMFGIDSVQVLRGPQGTLFGRNAFGGAINITTQNPTGRWGAESKLTLGNYGRKNLDAAFNFPLIDPLAARLDVLWANSNGFYRNGLDGGKAIGGDATLSMRLTTVFQPSDRLKVSLKYNFIDDQSDPSPNKYSADPPGNLFSVLAPAQYANFGTTDLRPGGTGGPFDVGFTNICKCNFLKENSASIKAVYQSPIGELTSISGSQHVQGAVQTDATGTPEPLLLSILPYSIVTFTQELRLLAEPTPAATLLGGLYYLDNSLDEGDSLYILLGSPASSTKRSIQNTHSSAAFFEGEYTPIKSVRLTAGARETFETKDFQFGAAVPVPYAEVNPPAGYAYTPLRASWQNFSPKLSLDYQISGGTMLYASWSKGFKAGGFQALASTAKNAGPYGDETVSAVELGVKTLLLDHRLRISADLFHEKLNGLQRTVTLLDAQGISNNLTLNAANALTQGVEIEASALPIDALTVKASLGYTNAYYSSFCANFTPLNTLRPQCGSQAGQVDNTNLALSNAPRLTGALSLDYVLAFAAGSASLHVENDYAAHSYTEDDNSPVSFRASASIVNASVKWSTHEDRLFLQFWGRNLTDRIVTEQGTLAAPLLNIWNPTAPRTFGVTAGAQY